MFKTEIFDDKIYIKNVSCFDLEQTLDCGQAFRWQMDENGVWSGVAYGKFIKIYRDGNDIVIVGSSMEDYNTVWRYYFDLERDYGKIITDISDNETLKKAAEYGSGIRILQQEPWEALCSFIISQNNNIPRIKGIIERLCSTFGEKCGDSYTFPQAHILAALEPTDLAPLRCGFRARYIIDAARKVTSGKIDLETLKSADADTAQKALMSITGVGPKVADCAMLFGLGKIDAFPKDVWIKRAMAILFADGLPDCARQYAGIVQQYIFYYARKTNLKLD